MDDVDTLIGLRIRMGRGRMGLSQREFADLLGVSVQQINKYESGKARVSAARLFEISGILNLSITEFFCPGGSPPTGKAPDAVDGLLPTDRRGGVSLADLRLLNNLNRMSASERQAVLALVQSITEGQDQRQRPAGLSGGTG